MNYRSFSYYYLLIFFNQVPQKNFSFILLPTVSHLPLDDDVTNGVSRHHVQSLIFHCLVITFNDVSMIGYNDVIFHVPRHHLTKED